MGQCPPVNNHGSGIRVGSFDYLDSKSFKKYKMVNLIKYNCYGLPFVNAYFISG